MINNFLLDVLAAGAILSGILVITSKNPVIAVLFLISVFINAAGYLILLGVGFIGITYIIVYIGAITVLFLFVIMMINIKLSDILDVGSQYTKNFPLALTIGSLFTYGIFNIIPYSTNNASVLSLPLALLNYLNELFFNSKTTPAIEVNLSLNPNNVDSVFSDFLQIEALGQGLYTYGAIWLLICSVILLLSMLAPIGIVHSKSNSNSGAGKTTHPSSGFNSSSRTKLVNVNLRHNLLNKNSYHTFASEENKDQALNPTSNLKLNPWTVTGLTDGEGCFGFTIHRRKERKLGFEIRPRFSFHMHAKEYLLLVQLKEFFGVGNVYCIGNSSFFVVSSREDLAIVIKHFELYPLLTSKLHSFFIFKIIYGMFCKKEHLSEKGFMKVVSYINCLNKPLEVETLELITTIYGPLPQLTLPPVVKHTIIGIPSPWWLVGFVCAEGCFSYRKVLKEKTNKLFFYFTMSISQAKNDKYILESIAYYLGAGKVYETFNDVVAQFEINNFIVIQHIILPFLSNFPLMGHKRKQYEIWLKAIMLTLCNVGYSKKREIELLELTRELSNLSGNMHKK